MTTNSSKSKRKVTDEGHTAVTIYRSNDGTVRQYAIFDPSDVRLGEVTSHTARMGLSAGYHEGLGSYSHRLRSWRNLTEAARGLDEARAR